MEEHEQSSGPALLSLTLYVIILFSGGPSQPVPIVLSYLQITADNRRKTNLPDQKGGRASRFTNNESSSNNAAETSDVICKCSSAHKWCIACP